MGSRQFLKWFGMVLTSSVVLVVLFSPGFLGYQLIGGSILQSFVGFCVILALGTAFFFGMRTRKHEVTPQEAVQGEIQNLMALSRIDVFTVNAKCLIEQIKRFDDKMETIDRIILAKFNPNEISYARFRQVMGSTQTLFRDSIRSVINRMQAFDEEDYRRIVAGQVKMSPTLVETKAKLYREHLDFINTVVEKNEEVLLRLDRLLLESSKMSSLEVENLDSMQAIRELDSLTEQARLYK